MQIADGGGYWPTTDWSQYAMPALWGHIEGQMNPGSTYSAPHWDLVAGWRKAIELASLNKGRLEMLRDDILQVWPTDRSPASAAYVKRLDELIESLNQIYEYSAKNYDAALAMVSSLATATHEVGDLHQKWLAQQQIINNLQPDLASKEGPRIVAAGKAGVYTTPSKHDLAARDIAAAQRMQADLETRARAHLGTLSADLNSARSFLQPPPPYQAPTLRSNENQGTTGAVGEGTGVSALVIPPVVPTATPAPAPAYKPAPLPSPGPDLSGVGIMPHAPAPALGPGIGGVGAVAGLNPAMPTTPMPGVIGAPPITGRSGSPVGSVMNGRPAMPAGGVIGGAGAPGRAASAGGMRANPPGGVIGASAARNPAGVSGGMGRAAQAGVSAGPMGAGIRPGRRQDRDEHGFDPDTEWEVAQGVAPVLDAAQESTPIDPGPAIGLR